MLELLLAGLAGLGIGLAVGNHWTYWISVRPLIDKIARLRYDGFRPETPLEQRPKTVPLPQVNET